MYLDADTALTGKRMLLLGIFKPLKENFNNSKLALKRNRELVKDRARALDHQSIGQIEGDTKELLAKSVRMDLTRNEEIQPRKVLQIYVD